MRLKLEVVAMLVCCLALSSVVAIDHETQVLLDKIENAPASEFYESSWYVYHMEEDMSRPGHILYTNRHSLSTTDGQDNFTITGNTTQRGYKEGFRSRALFREITGFTQVSKDVVVAVDKDNHCLRRINMTYGHTSTFSGQCQRSGYYNTRPAQFTFPWSIVKDNKNPKNFFVTDSGNQAIRSVDRETGSVLLFVRHPTMLKDIRYLTQHKSGDIYATADAAVYRITYSTKKIEIFAGQASTRKGYRDGPLLNSLFYDLYDLMFIGPDTLFVLDSWNSRIRLVDLNSKQVTTHQKIGSPYSLLLTHSSLYVGQKQKITQIQFNPSCKNRNMTVYVSSIKDNASVEITPGVTKELPVGTHTIQSDSCVVIIDVIFRDPLVVKRLDFVSEYDVKCSYLTDKLALSTLTSVADANINTIKGICQQDCTLQSKAALSCEADTLTATWPTDVTYSQVVSKIPDDIHKTLTDRLMILSEYPALNIVVVTRTPPLIYPTKTKSGAYAGLVLTTSCLKDKNYDQVTNSCI